MISVSGPLGELVSFRSESGLRLEGMYYAGTRGVVLHVHGSFGNFYSNTFVRQFAAQWREDGIGLLSFNLAAHDGIAEGDGLANAPYVGGALMPFESCVPDIGGAMSFLRERGVERVALEGHSLGCDRVVLFALERSWAGPIILLAPCDSYDLQVRWRAPELPEDQGRRLRGDEGSKDLLLPSEEYGVRGGGDWEYSIPISRTALLSIVEGFPFRSFTRDRATWGGLAGAAFVYMGSKDQLRTVGVDEMRDFLRTRIRRVDVLEVEGGDHMLLGCEGKVGAAVSDWLRAQWAPNSGQS